MTEVELFDKQTIEKLEWPEGALQTKKFLLPLFKNGIRFYIDNIDADVYALKVDEKVFPVIVNTNHVDNSWVVSPYAYYVSYPQEAVGAIKNKFVRSVVPLFFSLLGKFCLNCRINSAVYVNHWLSSTDLHGDLNEEQIHKIIKILTAKFPGHAIIFRSLNALTNKNLLSSLQNCGFNLIASRYIYVTDSKKEAIFQTRIVKSDLKQWRETSYEILNENKISLTDAAQLQQLYKSLYIDQHSKLNPQCNEQFFKLLLEEKLMRFFVLKAGNNYEGVAGYFEKEGVMFCPYLGYEQTRPNHTMIYRLLNTGLLLEAQKHKLVFHQSAGASFYKTLRRAEGCMESFAVYTKHLKCKQRFGWSTLKLLINSAGPAFMKKY